MGMNQLNHSLSVSVPLSLCSVADSFHDFSAGAQKFFYRLWENLYKH
jgi:hypothetical protein